MLGHRRRFNAATGDWDEFVRWRHGERQTKRTRRKRAGELRAWQKRQDRREAMEA